MQTNRIAAIAAAVIMIAGCGGGDSGPNDDQLCVAARVQGNDTAIERYCDEP